MFGEAWVQPDIHRREFYRLSLLGSSTWHKFGEGYKLDFKLTSASYLKVLAEFKQQFYYAFPLIMHIFQQ